MSSRSDIQVRGSAATSLAEGSGDGVPGEPLVGYERLRHFLETLMSMAHVYQPVMIKTILAGGGAATRRQIAAAFLAADLSQLEYYEQIVKGYPTDTLKRRNIIQHSKGVYRLTDDLARLNEWERASLMAICDAKLAGYIASRQGNIWRHRSQNFDPVPGTLRFTILERAMGRCEGCGRSNQEQALHVDHIEPRSKGGTNDPDNLQALCSSCNAQKLDRTTTDFHAAHLAFSHREPGCEVCESVGGDTEPLALIRWSDDGGSSFEVVARRHGSTYANLVQPEVNAMRRLELAGLSELEARGTSATRMEAHVGDGTPHCTVRVEAAARS
jgi:5-methylcytosine-specific restriction endonuclease McrA